MLRRRLWRSSSVRPSRVDAILRRRLYRHDDHDHRPTATEKGGRETQKTATDCEAAGGIRLRTSSASSPTRKNRNDAEDRRTHDPESEQQRGTNNTTAPVNKSRFENYDHTRGQGRGVGRGSVGGRGYMMGNESGGGRFRSGGRGRGRGRFGLPELMLCFTSAPSLAVRPSRVDAIFRRRLRRFGSRLQIRRLCLGLPKLMLCFDSLRRDYFDEATGRGVINNPTPTAFPTKGTPTTFPACPASGTKFLTAFPAKEHLLFTFCPIIYNIPM